MNVLVSILENQQKILKEREEREAHLQQEREERDARVKREEMERVALEKEKDRQFQKELLAIMAKSLESSRVPYGPLTEVRGPLRDRKSVV